jgi:hypothetical protein
MFPDALAPSSLPGKLRHLLRMALGKCASWECSLLVSVPYICLWEMNKIYPAGVFDEYQY